MSNDQPDTARESAGRRRLRREAIILVAMLFVGFVVLPAAVFIVGGNVFGPFDGGSIVDFYGDIASDFRSGHPVAIFLLLSPYLGLQLLRLTVYVFRHMAPQRAT